VNDTILIQSLVVAITAGTPLVLAGTGELLSQRSGVMNLGVEGMMLMGAVTGFWVTTVTGNAWVGLAAAALAGAATSLIHGVLAIQLYSNQIVSGIGIVILGTGLSQFIGEQGSPAIALRSGGGSFEPLVTGGLSDVPVIGPLLFSHDAIVYLSWVFVAATSWYLFRTRNGMKVRAVGNNPGAVDAAGISVARKRYAAVVVGGAAAGTGGGHMTLALFNSWSAGITAGVGWLAVVLVIFAAWRPWRLLVAAYTLGAISSLGFTFQLLGVGVPRELLSMLPFVVTFVVLVISTAMGGARGAPRALGEPYIREQR
jgi:simple sugar transport system permease protein